MKFKIAQVLFLITLLWSVENFLETQNPSTGQLPNISVSDFLADSPSLPEGLIYKQPDNPKELQFQGQGSKRSHQSSQQESKNDFSSSCQSKKAKLSNTTDMIQTRPEERVTDLQKLTKDPQQAPNATNTVHLDGQSSLAVQESTRYNICGPLYPEHTETLLKLYLLELKIAKLNKEQSKPYSSKQSSSKDITNNLTPQSMPVKHEEKPPLIRLKEIEKIEMFDSTRKKLFSIAQKAYLKTREVVKSHSFYMYDSNFVYTSAFIDNKLAYVQQIENSKTFANLEIVKLLCVMNKIAERVYAMEKWYSHNPSANTYSWTNSFNFLIENKQQYQKIC